MKNKRFLSMVLCFVLVASLFTGFVSTASADDVITHTVTKNQNLIKICKAYGLDYYQCKNAIMILNGYTSELNLNRLTVGQQIKLPATNAIAATVTGSSTTTTTTSTTTTVNGVSTTTTSSSTVNGVNTSYSVSYYLIPHVVKTGETLAGICTSYGTTYAQYASVILAANGLKSANYVWAGKTVYIPSSKAPSSGSCYAVVAHTVSSGETITSICSAYGTSYASNSQLINGINTGKNLNTIYAGQTLYVPVVATVSNTAGTASSTATQNTATVVQSGCYITFENSTKGSPYATVDGNIVSRADIGKTVTIIPNPKTGYAQEKVEVYRSDNLADIKVTNNSFVMPGCDVTIEITYQTGLAISCMPTLNGSFIALVNGVAADFAVVNDLVTLSLAPDAGYTCKEAYYITGSGSKTTITQSADGTWCFVMPDEQITIYVVYDRNSKMYNLSYYVTDQSSTGISSPASVSFSVDGTACTKAAKNTQITASISLKENYSIVAFYVNGGVIPATMTGSSTYVFKMPEGEAKIELVVNYTKYYALRADGNDGGTLTFTNSSGTVITSARVGDEVHVLAKANTSYVFQEGTIMVTYAGVSAKIATTAVASNEVKFTMVGADVNALAGWTKDETKTQGTIYMTSCTNGNSEIWVKPIFSNPGSTITKANTACVGDLVQIRVSGASTDFICTKLVAYQEASKTVIFDSTTATKTTDSANNAGVQYSTQNSQEIDSGSFIMPAGENICVEATFSTVGYYVNIKNYSAADGSASAYIGEYGVTEARLGTTITIRVSTAEGYTFSRLILKRGSTGYEFEVPVTNGQAQYTLVADDYTETVANNYIEIKPVYSGGNTHTLSNYGSNYTINGAVVSSMDIEYGSTVTLTANAGKTFGESIVLYSGSEADGSRTDLTYSLSSDKRTLTFTMPNKDVYLNAETVGQMCTTIWNAAPGTLICSESGTTQNEQGSVVTFTVEDPIKAYTSVQATYTCDSATNCTWLSTGPNGDGSGLIYTFSFEVTGDNGIVDIIAS